MNKLNQLITLFLLFVITISLSCTDPCEDVTCVNGECIEGICECEKGFEGIDCSTTLISKFLGDYVMVTETCSISGIKDVPYIITISPFLSRPDEFQIGDFTKEIKGPSIGTVGPSSLEFNILSQTFGFFGKDLDGSGSIDLSNNTIQLTYTVYNYNTGEILDECTATYKRI